MADDKYLLPFLLGQNTNRGLMHKLQSPIQEEFREGDYAVLRNHFPIVPFLDCGDATLRVLRDLSELSPTQAACTNSQIGYATAAGLGLRHVSEAIKKQNNKERIISDSAHDSYVDFLQTQIGTTPLLRKILRVLRNLKCYGNAVVEVVLTQTGRVRSGEINVYDADMFRYRIPKGAAYAYGGATYLENPKQGAIRPTEDLYNMGIQTGYISPRWTVDYIARNSERVVEYPVYTLHEFAQGAYFARYNDDTLRCLLHLRDEAVDRQWYGLPSSISGIYYQFMEFQSGKYATRGYENQWLPAAMIEVEEAQQIDTKQRQDEMLWEIVNQLANMYTNRGDGTKIPVLYRTRPIGAAPSTVTQFNSRPDKGFHKEMTELAAGEILKANQWHRSLLEKTVGSIGNNSEHRDLARITDATVVRPMQEAALLPFRWAISQIEQWVGYTNSERLEIDLKSIFEADSALVAQDAQQQALPPTM